MISSSEPLVHRCGYMGAGALCHNGYLFHYEGDQFLPVAVEGQSLQCPKCEGKGLLLSNKGRELLAFLEVFARPLLRDLVDELFEERKQH
jgi:hypothetical protein